MRLRLANNTGVIRTGVGEESLEPRNRNGLIGRCILELELPGASVYVELIERGAIGCAGRAWHVMVRRGVGRHLVPIMPLRVRHWAMRAIVIIIPAHRPRAGLQCQVQPH